MTNQLNNFNITSLNAKGLGNFKKRTAVFRWLKRGKSDIIFVQEAHCTQQIENSWRKEWGGDIVFSHGASNSKGCLIMINKNFDCNIVAVKTDFKGRFIILQLEIQDTLFVLINVYLPNTEKEQLVFYHDLSKVMHKHQITSERNIIMGGDWNIVKSMSLDKSGGAMNFKHKSLEELDEIINKLEVNDTWRIKNPSRKRFTWRQNNPLIQCRLDFFLTSDHLYDKFTNFDIVPSIHSDHSAITLSYQQIEAGKKGPGFWKFNNSLLNDEEFKRQVSNTIEQAKIASTEIQDKRVQWEMLKYIIRNFCIKYSKNKQKKVKTRQQVLEKRLIDLEKQISTDETKMQEYEGTKSELKLIEAEKINGIIVRSKVTWYEQGEASTRYFFNLEKQNAARKHIQKLKLDNGQEITDQKAILLEEFRFYESLYNKPDLDNNEFDVTTEHFLQNSSIPQLHETMQAKCEGLLTTNECFLALQDCKKNKSPGNDGLTYEFYLTFWDSLNDSMINSFNYSFNQSEMSVSQRQAVISLIDKKGKDRQYLKNWRPISLLNNDYKLASKAIAFRLKKVIHHLIHYDQSGFVENRNISFALRTVQDIMEITNMNNDSGLLLLIDFEKAFDTINITFLKQVLNRFNFGPSFRQWIDTFYANISSCVINNQTSSKYFDVKRGVRQGDPLSPYLFILVVEILSLNIRDNKAIHGIRCGNKEIKLVQYADDTTGIFKNIKSAKEFLKAVELFSKCSGLKLNREKTEALWLGKDKSSHSKPLGISWPDTPIKLLGLYIGHNMKDLEISNFKHKLTKIKKQFQSWIERDLSIVGRILIVKSLAISKFSFLFNLITFPQHIIKEIKQCIYEFVWKGKTRKIKDKVLIQDYEYGGCRMVDIESSIKAEQLKWIKMYLGNEGGVWRKTMKQCIGVENLNMLLRGNFDAKLLPKCTPFYREVLKCWSEEKYVPKQDEREYSNEFIFYNKNITINKHMIYNDSIRRAGIWCVQDLFIYKNGSIFKKNMSSKGLKVNEIFLINSIISAIPKSWRRKIITTEFQNDGATLEYKSKVRKLVELSTRDIKDIFIEKMRIIPTAQKKYSEDFNIAPDSWKKIYVRPKEILFDNKIFETQFKILHNYQPSNRLLYRMGKIPTDKCNFCALYSQNLYHLLFDCLLVRNFWFKVEDYLSTQERTKPNILKFDVFCGNSNEDVLFNKILFYGKYYIIRCKNNDEELSIENFVLMVEYMTEFENLIKH